MDATTPPALETTVYQIDPRKLSRLKRNARFMTGEQMRRLTDNIKRDGALTSVPLVYNVEGTEGGTLLVLSGNHRVEGAISAGEKSIWVMEITTRLDEKRMVAIQLSHNAITGQDDPNLLFELYQELDLSDKLYSGLTDDDFKMDDLDLVGIGGMQPAYEEVTLLFLPAEAEAFKTLLQEIEKRRAKQTVLVADKRDYNDLFDTVIRTKEARKVYNTAIAMRVVLDLAIERLDQIDAERGQSDANPT